MFDGAGDAPTEREQITPDGLTPGDVVMLGGSLFEVLSEPFLGITGSSVFDIPRPFWRASVCSLGRRGHAAEYATWAADEPVVVYGRRYNTAFPGTSVQPSRKTQRTSDPGRRSSRRGDENASESRSEHA